MFTKSKSVDKIVAELSDLLAKHNLTEIEYEYKGQKIKISNAKPVAGATVAAAMPGVPGNSPTAAAMGAVASAAAPNLENAVKSPMVGVAYLRPEPGAKDFVQEGQKVGVGDILCLIEAMKTFNPVKAAAAGTVKKILIKESETVEYGQPLFIVE
ncbi:MAG: acetyl-CoA carboxylase, biotin carboxyl carrier protein [Alphaproteobacteria bacterium]|nr:acetyl-CoA carboxylase, biotin carboxyl carrier protein [Alphaproteobacteria bacterium]